MAGPNFVLDKGWLAGEAMTKYEFVKLVGSETINACDTQGERALGVLQEEVSAADATNGRIASVRVLGISRVIAGATISEFDLLTVGADGRAEVAATGDVVVGTALQDAVDGDHMDILLSPSGHVQA